MADVLVVSERSEDLLALVSCLHTGGHRVAMNDPDEASRGGAEPDITIIDATKDLSRARDVCRSLRARSPSAPLIALVGAENLDAIGPDWHIDSFIVDPVVTADVLARVRLTLGARITESSETVRVGDLTIDPATYQVRLRGRPLDLTYKEFQLLFYLAQHPGRVYSRQQLLQEVWGYDFFGGTRTVDVHVRRLRAKLGAEHENMIATIRNVGYKLEAHR